MKNFDFNKTVFSTPKFTDNIPKHAGQKGTHPHVPRKKLTEVPGISCYHL